jgi:threonine/homoserine/homoserine lactone efflux protein
MDLFLKGIAGGFIIALPLGPVSLLCFRRVLTGSRMSGLVTVLGAAAADTIYGLIAALGLHAVTHALLAHRAPLRIGGGLFLLYLGISMLRSHPDNPGSDPTAASSLPGAFFSAFLLMLANPTVILSFLAVFAAIDLAAEPELYRRGAPLGLAIFLGSSAWWLVYTLAALRFRGRLGLKELRAINVGTGSLITAFGVWQLVDLLRGK